uniref:Uncharacterized protein n=1 Tax=Helianthus annuus TaxID=4232 RepID=A0A251UA69_HELAN
MAHIHFLKGLPTYTKGQTTAYIQNLGSRFKIQSVYIYNLHYSGSTFKIQSLSQIQSSSTSNRKP